MVTTYRRPGVYLEESLLVNPSEVAGTVTVGAFVGVAGKGMLNTPVLIESWSDYVTQFGGFDVITPPAGGTITTPVLSYLPYAVYSYFQNGGRMTYIIRAAPTTAQDAGSPATVAVNGTDTGGNPLISFNINASSVGTWGDDLQYSLATQSTIGSGATTQTVFGLQVLLKNPDGIYEVVETFANLSVTGQIAGSRKVDTAINDSFSGSRYIRISGINYAQPAPETTDSGPIALAGGVDAGIPNSGDLTTACTQLAAVDGPINLNIAGYMSDASAVDTTNAAESYVSTTIPSSTFTDREDIFIINDSAPPREPGQDNAAYSTTIQSSLGANTSDSYSASYGPWIIIPDPKRVGATISIPPGGAVAGMIARIDATVGYFRAPAGMIAGLSNAVGVQTKFTDTQLGDLNSRNINIVRPVVGAGICVMGARTRKTYGADRYVSARRTLINVKEQLRRSTQWAVFENNDARLWSGLRMQADRILRPIWEAGGLAGANAAEAYYITCDETTNPPAVVQSGEVRMEIGVALEYPAEFVIIRITQFDRGSFAADVSPNF